MAMTFKKATKSQARLRMAIAGPSGSGKTYSSLRIARGLAGPGGTIALIDTERASASKYAGLIGDFDTLSLDTFGPDTYIQAIHAAEEGGYAVLIIDSLSHAWEGTDGALDMVDAAAKRSRSGNSYTAWRDVTPLHRGMVDAILQSRLHVIVTLRVKTEYVIEKDERTGKSTPRKVGLKPIQRDGIEYEFDLVGDIDQFEHQLVISKSRCEALSDKVVRHPGEELGKQIAAWLSDGAPAPVPDSTPRPIPATQTAPAPKPVSSSATLATPAQKGALAQRIRDLYGVSTATEVKDRMILLLGRDPNGSMTVDDLALVSARLEEVEALAAMEHGEPDPFPGETTITTLEPAPEPLPGLEVATKDELADLAVQTSRNFGIDIARRADVWRQVCALVGRSTKELTTADVATARAALARRATLIDLVKKLRPSDDAAWTAACEATNVFPTLWHAASTEALNALIERLDGDGQ